MGKIWNNVMQGIKKNKWICHVLIKIMLFIPHSFSAIEHMSPPPLSPQLFQPVYYVK